MATNFLWFSGTGNNGLAAAALSLLAAELNALANAAAVLSSAGGVSGKFDQGNTGQAVWGELFLTLGAIGTALSSSANICGWFVQSYDGGTTYEQSAAAQSRPPDFIIPLPSTAIGAAAVYKAAGLVRLPALPFKVQLQNNTGQNLAASGNVLRLAPIAEQF